MRPHLDLRARSAVAALGALCMAISLAVLPGTARSEDPTTGARAAIAADIAPGKSRLNVLAGRQASVKGRVRDRRHRAAARSCSAAPASAGRRSAAPRRGAGGAFRFRFRPRESGSARLRVLVDAARREIGRLNVYRRAAVSWYGPGLYGNKLSCGGRLTPGTLGVAHKTLPCGARVTLRKGDRVLRVRVVDRGPYVGGREFDLTSATRESLHFGGVGSLLVAS